MDKKYTSNIIFIGTESGGNGIKMYIYNASEGSEAFRKESRLRSGFLKRFRRGARLPLYRSYTGNVSYS